jgi:hypothetical protein
VQHLLESLVKLREWDDPTNKDIRSRAEINRHEDGWEEAVAKFAKNLSAALAGVVGVFQSRTNTVLKVRELVGEDKIPNGSPALAYFGRTVPAVKFLPEFQIAVLGGMWHE